MAEPVIYIRPEPFGVGFDVTVEPALEGDSLNREFATHRSARGYAGGIRLVKRWPIIDLACDEHLQDVMKGGAV